MGLRVVVASLLVFASAARGGTLDVPGQYATIQAAIDAAHPGDAIVVRPGTYREAISLPAFDLTLTASGGASATTIDATGLAASVVRVTGAGSYAAVIDGFTITGGLGTEVSANSRRGGGVFVAGGDVTLRHCRITHNGASTPYLAGGGVFGRARLEDCEVSHNVATDGGGVGVTYSQPATLIGCTILANIAQRGGGLSGDFVLTDCTISGNSAQNGGGLYSTYVMKPTRWLRVTFARNRAEAGGGCFIDVQAPVVVSHATFLGNSALAGAAMWIYDDEEVGPTPGVVDCVFIGNLTAGGGLSIDSSTYSTYFDLAIENSTFVSEQVFATFVRASIFWKLRAPLSPDINIQSSDVEGGYPGLGNISSDPQFVDLAANDVHLKATSPCRNAAVSNQVWSVDATDLDGEPRVLEGHVDIGADEFADDCNANGILDWQDLLAGTSVDCDHNGLPDECDPFIDCNGNGVRDACDIAAGASTDCDHDGVPDECESLADCNGNGVPDICDVASGASADCDHDRVPDECENLPDCNGNGVADVCDISSGTSLDCNGNGIPDACDVAAGTSRDTNGDGVPDECQHVIHVPTDEPTLQAAVSAASALDIIVIEPGVYAGPENRNVTIAKTLIIMGATTASECVIDAGGGGRIFDIVGQAGHVTLGALTLRHGTDKGGGAIRVSAEQSAVHLFMHDCILLDNTGQTTPGGALAVKGGASAEMTGCLFAGNQAGNGGAVAVFGIGSTAAITRCSFYGNAATIGNLGPPKGGALFVHSGGRATLRDCIGVGDSAVEGPEFAAHGAGSIVDVAWCDVAGGEAGVAVKAGGSLLWGAGNIDADPLFKNAAADDFRLAGDSPCIDSGDPSAPPDADGTPADMGALPFQPFQDLGHALPGALGAPKLSGAGTATPGDTLVLTLHGAAPLAPATLVLGADLLLAPFKGGVMTPSPGLLITPLAVDANGVLRVSGHLPADVPAGATIIAQIWVPDAGGPAGYAASNGLSIEAR